MKVRRIVAAVLAAGLASVVIAAPANASIRDLRTLTKKIEALGYTCDTKPFFAGYRETTCRQGDSSIHAVAFMDNKNYKIWAPMYCDLGGGLEGFVTNGKTWIVDSRFVPLQELRKAVGAKSIKRC